MTTAPEDVISNYYDALRRGDPLGPFFLDADPTLKIGVGETLVGHEAVVEGLREQTVTTDAWSVESDGPVVAERDGYATFADEVSLAWTDRGSGARRRFETRWTGTLERRDDADASTAWGFVSMHVSAPESF